MTVPHNYTPVAVDGSSTSLGEGLIATLGADSPASEAQPYLEVVAPATLPEGYEFDADANGHSFTVKVPVGGVEEGQKFSVPFPAGANGYSGSAIPRASIPVGHWKDGFCDCFRHGIIHPVVWNALCCPLILIGQVMHRLKLTWLAKEGTSIGQTASTFRICFTIALVYTIISQFLEYLMNYYVNKSTGLGMQDPSDASPWTDERWDMDTEETEKAKMILSWRWLLSILFYMFVAFLVGKTRQTIRSRYSIPEQQCPGTGMEDCLCAFWCNCCTVAQMARHTADYDTYAGFCCSETGMPPHAPSIVV